MHMKSVHVNNPFTYLFIVVVVFCMQFISFLIPFFQFSIFLSLKHESEKVKRSMDKVCIYALYNDHNAWYAVLGLQNIISLGQALRLAECLLSVTHIFLRLLDIIFWATSRTYFISRVVISETDTPGYLHINVRLALLSFSDGWEKRLVFGYRIVGFDSCWRFFTLISRRLFFAVVFF